MEIQTKEARIILAIDAIQSSRKINCRSAAKIYKVLELTLRDRMAGRTPRAEGRSNCHKLNDIEEDIIVRYILGLDSRGFAPRIAGVEDMANYLLETRRGKRVGKLWAYRFVRRRLELKTRFNRVYDFQRALCEDPELLSAWF